MSNTGGEISIFWLVEAETATQFKCSELL